MNIKYRVKFNKGEGVKYISHLDVLRIFQRALKRAEIPVAYSKGFNPHQLLSFAHPLSLGYTSTGEYGDVEIQSYIPPEEFKSRLNSVMPITMEINDVVLLDEKAENAMASVAAAEYEAVLDKKIDNLGSKINNFLKQEEIVALKKTKHSKKEVNIRPDIYKMEDVSENGVSKIYMFLAAGSVNNVRADLVLESFYKFINQDFDKYKIRFCRKDLLRYENGKYVKLNIGVGCDEKNFN